MLQGGDSLTERWRRVTTGFAGEDLGRSVLLQGDSVMVGVGADAIRPGASVLKVFVAVAAQLAGARGELDLAETIAIRDLPASVNPSVLTSLTDEHRFTTSELAGLMLATSDNRIADHLVNLVGFDAVNRTAAAIGCTATELAAGFGDDALGPSGRANVTTAADCAVVLAAIWRLPELQTLRAALRSSLFNSRILALMPDEVIVAHKTGTLTGVVNDVGVIHATSGDFIACFLSDGQPDQAGTAGAIARCARDAYFAWEQR